MKRKPKTKTRAKAKPVKAWMVFHSGYPPLFTCAHFRWEAQKILIDENAGQLASIDRAYINKAWSEYPRGMFTVKKILVREL